ncbi:OmpA family protein [Gaetbulibacter jejuensis]|uniref:OmpA family protein n=1 Tax=Gaetbulibacter jejuensis TaxID=584607 RepID=A0ABN1JGJ7_9FLAO
MKLENKIKTLAFTVIVLVSVLSQTSLQAQERQLKKADKEYDNMAYSEAVDEYLKAVDKGYGSEALFKKLGNSYYFNANYDEALKWYKELFNITQNTEPEYYLRYAQSLKATGNDSEAKQWYDTYLNKVGAQNNDLNSASDYLSIIGNNEDRYSLSAININTKGIEYATNIHNDTLMLTRSKGSTGSIINNWDGNSFLDVFIAPVNSDGSIGKTEKIKGDVNTKYHESSAVITKDGQTMYFTRSNTSPKGKRSKKETKHLKIYRAHLVNGKWKNIEELSINGDNYDTAHPMLNPKEDKLYFVSNRPETLGATDLFVASINSDGSLGTPTNLGPKVNTKGRESFPFITKDNELYFSSDGHFGLGGYDVFYAKLIGNSIEGNIVNVGSPINSKKDDFGFIIENKKGYISSNRQGGDGYDDIYAFTELKPIKELTESLISGTVLDKDTKKPLRDAIVTVVDEDNKEVTTVKTDQNGRYKIEPIDPMALYILKVVKVGYNGDDVFSKRSKNPRQHDFELKKQVVEVVEQPKSDLPERLDVLINFDFDKHNIRPDAQIELERVVDFMKRHTTVKLDIRSHTDSRGNDQYNMLLSDRRAKATIDYLVSRGIDRSRLTGRGYGEIFLLNRCSNGVTCSSRDHEMNRRSEFIVIQ